MKLQLMSLLIIILLFLMLAEVYYLILINLNKNNLASQIASRSNISFSSITNFSILFSKYALERAIITLANYELRPYLRKNNFITNTSIYLSNLIYNGVLPNSTLSGNVFTTNSMSNYTLSHLLKVLSSLGLSNVNISKPRIFQNSYSNISLAYSINFTLSSKNYSILINTSIPLYGLPNLYSAEQGSYKTISFFNLSSSVIRIGGYAIYGKGFYYGVSELVPSRANCTTINSYLPNYLVNAPNNKSVIIVDPSSLLVGNCINKFGALITSQLNSSVNYAIPYLVYSSSSPIFNELYDNEKIFISSGELSTFDIEPLLHNIYNNSFFYSPFAPSYLSWASSSFIPSSYGIASIENAYRLASTFNGKSSYIALPYNSIVNPGNNFTISVWFKSNASGVVLSNQNNPGLSGQSEYSPVIYINDQGYLSGGDWIGSQPFTTSIYVANNKWFFVTIVQNQSIQKLYVNGRLVATARGKPQTFTSYGWFIGYGYTNGWQGTNNGNEFFSGQIANLQFYNITLNSSQIANLYARGIDGIPLSNGLVAWYILNGNANDYSGNNYNGTPNAILFNPLQNYSLDSILPYQNGYLPIPGINCYNYSTCFSPYLRHLYVGLEPLELSSGSVANVSNGYIEQDEGFAFMNNQNQEATISIWVYPFSSSGGDIVDELGQSTPDVSWHDTWIDMVNGNVYIRIWDLPSVNLGPIPIRQWSNIVMVLTYSNGAINYSGYIDGVYRNSNIGIRSVPGDSNLMYYPISTIDSTNSGNGNHFNGLVSNYQFYSSALPKAEIEEIYKRGLYGTPLNSYLVAWWPLNGNANDYSNNGYNSSIYNVSFTNSFSTLGNTNTYQNTPISFWNLIGLYLYNQS